MTDLLPIEIWEMIALRLPNLEGWMNFSLVCKQFHAITSRLRTKRKFQNRMVEWKEEWPGIRYQALPNGLKHGKWNFQTQIGTFWREGKKDGCYLEYFIIEDVVEDSLITKHIVKVCGYYYHGIKTGWWNEFYPSGNKKTKVLWMNDMMAGKYHSYYDLDTPTIKYYGHYSWGKKVGVWTNYDHRGNMIKLKDFG